MVDFRIRQHPILPPRSQEVVGFYWNGTYLEGVRGETIAASLFANGIHVFGHHPKDGSPQGIYCANGQCAQCLVLKDGLPVKACMELIHPGIHITPTNQLPVLPMDTSIVSSEDIEEKQIPVLIIGGGPAGLSAAIELGKLGIETLLIDDKHQLGGKLVLQTHRFFGSTQTVYAGMRGIDIANRLEEELKKYTCIEVWLNSTALAVFSDKKVGVLKEGIKYTLIKPEVLLIASGAREKSLVFKGNTLPGVYGAGAFQTLINRDMVKAANQIFIIGGGNVGLITGYHALQAGIKVVGLVEALPVCGGYKVHKDKLARLGVPIFTSHTIVSANGNDNVESVTIAKVDEAFRLIQGTEKTFPCDTVLIAVGLDPVNEFYLKARQYNLPAYAAGDADEIAEASAAIYSGRIKGLEIANLLGFTNAEVPADWFRSGEILKSKPGKLILETLPETIQDVMPVIHCNQEIPCDPCSTICPNGLIIIDPADIRSIPEFTDPNGTCIGCERCLVICPGLAVTLVDYRKNNDLPIVSIPYELARGSINASDIVEVVDTEGASLGLLQVTRVLSARANDRTTIVMIRAPKEFANRIAGIRVQAISTPLLRSRFTSKIADDTVICRCERVTSGEIRALIHQGYRDLNEIKAITRAGMGACGSKTCKQLIHRLFKEENVSPNEIVDQTLRPVFIEVPLGILAGETKLPGEND